MVLPISKEGNAPLEKSREQQQPKRSFRDVLNRKPIPQATKWSIFDFAKSKKPPMIRKERPKEKNTFEQAHAHAEAHVEMRTVSGEEEVSSISELSPAIQDLVNKMEDYISIESHKGIATIELQMELEDPYGQFHGTVIRIDHYNTDPHGFNILLMNPNQSAVDELTAHLPALLKVLQMKLERFHINLLPPAFPKLEETKSTRKINKTFRGEKKSDRKIERNPFLN